MLTSLSDLDLRGQGKTFLQVSRFKPGAAAQATTAQARFVDIAWDKDAAPMLGLKDAPSGWGTGVSKTSHNVDIALAVLNAAYEDSALMNLICFGEEGIDYTINADGLWK